MSLDKFVMRGFTASAGSSDGSWIGRASTPENATQKIENTSSSFVLGGNGGLIRNFRHQGPQQSSIQQRQNEQCFDRDELLTYGGGARREIPKNCLGSARRGGGATPGVSSNAVVGVWLALAAVVVMLLIMSESHSKKVASEWRERRANDYYGEAE